MKNKSLLFYFFTTISTLNLFGEEIQTDMVSTFRKNPHAISFGQDTFCLDVHSEFYGIKAHGSTPFVGFNLEYEHLKPDAFYFGIDATAAIGNPFDAITIFLNLESRFGYTISGLCWLITPFLCIGGYDFGSAATFFTFEATAAYLGAGFHSRYEVSDLFNLGVNLKAFGSPYSEERWNFLWHEERYRQPFWGTEIGIPLTWRVGPMKQWDIQFEPYYSRLTFREGQNIYGGRLHFSYHF